MQPDPARSAAVLVGGSIYTNFPNLPAVQRNLTKLSECLQDPSLWGLPSANCQVVAGPSRSDQFLDPVHNAARDAVDTLIVYYAGHGLLDPWNGELYLALTDSVAGRPYTSVPYEWLRRILVDCSAHRRIVVLDCCFSGTALGTMWDAGSAIADHASAEGTFVLAAAPENRAALSPEGEHFTAFTGELIDLFDHGVDGGPELLTLDYIYRHIRGRLQEKARPEPQKRDRNTAGSVALVRNKAYVAYRSTSERQSPNALHPSAPVPVDSSRLFAGRYELRQDLDSDGMSEVHRAVDTWLDRDVAVKILRSGRHHDPPFLKLIQREAQFAAALRHPAIVSIYDVGAAATSGDGPRLYVVTEYVDGWSLRYILREQGRLELRRALQLTAQICTALEFSHSHGIVHCGIRPANVMITRSSDIKVLNFGISKALAEGIPTVGMAIGTAQYMSPEHVNGEELDARSDIYSTGCVLFELLTGAPLFSADAAGDLVTKHVSEEPRRPSSLNSEITTGVDEVVMKALAKNPAVRYQSAADFRSHVDRLLDQDLSKVVRINPGVRQVIGAADVHNVVFSKPPLGKRGYSENEVDAFLDLIEADRLKEQDEALSLTAVDVHNVVFSKPPLAKRGYSEDEVDTFLDLVEAECERRTKWRSKVRPVMQQRAQ